MSKEDRRRRRAEKQRERSLGVRLIVIPPVLLAVLFGILFVIHLVMLNQGGPMNQAAMATLVVIFLAGACASGLAMATGVILIVLARSR